MQNFAEVAAAMQDSGAGIVVHSGDDLQKQAENLLSNEREIEQLGERGYAVIRRHQGATERNMEIIKRFIIQ
jgi:3-deoxy-D-manno-octulosonic-acid transferase